MVVLWKELLRMEQKRTAVGPVSDIAQKCLDTPYWSLFFPNNEKGSRETQVASLAVFPLMLDQ